MGVYIGGNITMGTRGGPPRVPRYNGIGPIMAGIRFSTVL